MRRVASASTGIHNTALWRHPYKGWHCKYSVRNLRHEGEMKDQIPDSDGLPVGLPEEEHPPLAPYLWLGVI